LVRLAALVCLPLVLLAPWGQDPVAANGTVHYVDADADGASNGSSWGDAFTELQLALDAAASGDQIWVAEGTYTPTVEHGGTGDRYKSFQMANGVAIYGGFDGTETELGQRDWEAHPTILSGDLNGDDGPDFANNEENSYHVFYHPEGTNLESSAILDGFTISGGNANGDAPHAFGGGMCNYGSSPVLTNCSFEGNWAYSGGGMFNNDSCSPVLTNCTFKANWASEGGGMQSSYYSYPTLTNCTFAGNSAGVGGGIYSSYYSYPTLTNCTFSGNSASSGGGMFNFYYSYPTLTNCTFSGNSASSGGGMYNANSASPALTNCILWGDTPEEIYNDDSTPVVTYSDVQGGYPGEGNIDVPPFFVDPDNGDFHLHACSTCIDAGDNDAPDLPPYDFEGDDRILDGDGIGMAIVDMGVDEVAVVGTCLRVHLPVVLKGY